MKYLRNRNDGTIYEWDPILDKNPLCEPVTEEEAFPERFVSSELVDKVIKSRSETKSRGLDLSTKNVTDAPLRTPLGLAKDAARGLPK